jgi:hypothetical protein
MARALGRPTESKPTDANISEDAGDVKSSVLLQPVSKLASNSGNN